MRNSFFNMRPGLGVPWYKLLAHDLWDNQFLFWSVILGFVTVFPVVYIPVINKIVFLHGPLGYQWGLSVAFTVLFLAGCEVWKWFKRVYYRRPSKKQDVLTTSDPFLQYATFSKLLTLSV